MEESRQQPDVAIDPVVEPVDGAADPEAETGGALAPHVIESPTDDPAQHAAAPMPGSVDKGRLVRAIALYTALRIGLIAVLTVGLMFVMPLIVALAFAVVLQLPLALLLFRGPRHQLTAALAQAKSHRTAEHDRLRAALMGGDSVEG